MSSTNLLYLLGLVCAFGFMIPVVAPQLMNLDKAIDSDAANKKPWE